MKALGKGSVASIVRVGLMVAWIGLWLLAATLVLVAVGYSVALVLVANGVLDPALLAGDGDGPTLGVGQQGGLTWPIVLPVLLIAIVAIGGALIIVWRLRKLFESFTSGEPFRRENAQHLRVIWITMLVVELARYALLALTGVMLATFGEGVDADYTLQIDLSTWGAILILIVLAEVFREGARLKEEQELTI